MGTGSKKKKANQYYVVISGHVSKPTIYSSWADAQPLVTGFPNAKFRGFPTWDQAQEYMASNDVHEYDKRLRDDGVKAESHSPVDYYAVANGRSPGVKLCYSGPEGAEKDVKGFSGACHQKFSTLEQAEAFIRNWEESFSSVNHVETKQWLAQGYRPTEMKTSGDSVTLNSETAEEEAVLASFEALSIRNEASGPPKPIIQHLPLS